jgi:hypothetical protein
MDQQPIHTPYHWRTVYYQSSLRSRLRYFTAYATLHFFSIQETLQLWNFTPFQRETIPPQACDAPVTR